MVRKHRSPDDVLDEIYERAIVRGQRPTFIHRALVDRLSAEGRMSDVPGLRTVQDIVKGFEDRDVGNPWSIADAPASEIRPVLGAMAALIRGSLGRVTSLTNAEARWVVKLTTAYPDIPPVIAYSLARLYLMRLEAGSPVTDLDCFLAYEPWSDPERYLAQHLPVLAHASLPAAPGFLRKLAIDAANGEDLSAPDLVWLASSVPAPIGSPLRRVAANIDPVPVEEMKE